MASRTATRAFSLAGTIGSRTVSVHLPISDIAYLTGAGLVSTNRLRCTGASLSWIFRAAAKSPRPQAACQKGDYATALKLQDKLAPLHINLFVETSPAPVKYALSLLGKCANTVRLPLVPTSDKGQAAVREAMVHAGLIN